MQTPHQVSPGPATGDLGARLDTAARAALTAGIDMWHLAPAPSLGLRSMTVSDGPAGVRGSRWFAASSACVPCGSALGATWSRETVAEVATVLAAETRRKAADVLLAPTVNLHRHPLAGRNFECYSEDPELTAALAAAYITALQDGGVAACVKHFVANDQETDRHDISAIVPEVALRELYLRPFEAAVREAGVWAVMSAYNRLDGTHCSQNATLLTDILRTQWGFDGVVVSDWGGTHDTAALAAGLDVEMPGPARHLGPAVLTGIEDGSVPPAALDRAVEGIVTLALRVGALGAPGHEQRPAPEVSIEDPADREVLRRAAVESLVLLRNEPAPSGPPLVPLPDVGRIALIGPNAASTAVMGGGSAAFVPHRRTSVLEALRERTGDTTAILHRRGVPPPTRLQELGAELCRTGPDPAAPRGFLVEHFATPEPDAEPVVSEHSPTSRLLWLGGPSAPGGPEQDGSVRLRTWLTPRRGGRHTLGLVTGATGYLTVDDTTVLDNRSNREPGTAFMGLGSAEITAEVELTAGVPVRIEAVTTPLQGIPAGGLIVGFGEPDDDDPLRSALDCARSADVAVVVVGGDDQWESEGADRAGFQLPGNQGDLVESVLEVNPATVVLVNCGAPVDLSFAASAPALMQIWYPGQEAGDAVADVLLGEADPGGRLPTTFGRRLEDWSSNDSFPGSGGEVVYAEGLHLGYRGFDASGTAPAFCFGHGLSTTTFAWSDASLDRPIVETAELNEGTPGACARVRVTNTGDRPGTEVVQCYLSPTGGEALDPSRPPQHLAGFSKAHLGPGASAVLEIPLGWTALRRWSPGSGWTVPEGTWEVRLSSSSQDHRARLALAVQGPN